MDSGIDVEPLDGGYSFLSKGFIDYIAKGPYEDPGYPRIEINIEHTALVVGELERSHPELRVPKVLFRLGVGTDLLPQVIRMTPEMQDLLRRERSDLVKALRRCMSVYPHQKRDCSDFIRLIDTVCELELPGRAVEPTATDDVQVRTIPLAGGYLYIEESPRANEYIAYGTWPNELGFPRIELSDRAVIVGATGDESSYWNRIRFRIEMDDEEQYIHNMTPEMQEQLRTHASGLKEALKSAVHRAHLDKEECGLYTQLIDTLCAIDLSRVGRSEGPAAPEPPVRTR